MKRSFFPKHCTKKKFDILNPTANNLYKLFVGQKKMLNIMQDVGVGGDRPTRMVWEKRKKDNISRRQRKTSSLSDKK